jgi:hypothetical protein
MTVFSGQMENAGHFAHPTASAMGQSVMTAPWAVRKRRAYADVAALAGRKRPALQTRAEVDPRDPQARTSAAIGTGSGKEIVAERKAATGRQQPSHDPARPTAAPLAPRHPHFTAISSPLVDSPVHPLRPSAILRSIKTFARDSEMFDYDRPTPHVHILRLRGHRAVRRVVTGTALVLLGIGYLLRQQGLIGSNDLWLIVPLLIALSGVARLVAAPGWGGVARAGLRLAVAAYLVVVIEHLGGWTFSATWPVLLIAAGLSQVGYAFFSRRLREESNW